MTASGLTVGRRVRYKAALAALFLAFPALSRAGRVAGAVLPDEARPVELNRYVIGRTYEDTLKFYKTVYPAPRHAWTTVVSQPGLRAVHIENPDARPGTWDGLNVYELRGETRVFVLVAPGGEADKEKKGRRK
jgi:hypothetical protein